MSVEQREQNPDVNSFNPDVEPAEDPGATDTTKDQPGVEQPREDDVIPVPPDAHPTAPVEEPPGRERTPVGDVDDSPKRIA